MLDPRSKSKERIVPPEPLPFVSRKALGRVKDWMAPPSECPYCDNPVELVNNSQIYTRSYGDWPYVYWCRPCDAYVGLHPQTDLPLGTLADAALRDARKQSKREFLRVSKKLGMGRSTAYTWLAQRMEIDKKLCHFGMFDGKQCLRAYRILKTF